MEPAGSATRSARAPEISSSASMVAARIYDRKPSGQRNRCSYSAEFPHSRLLEHVRSSESIAAYPWTVHRVVTVPGARYRDHREGYRGIPTNVTDHAQ